MGDGAPDLEAVAKLPFGIHGPADIARTFGMADKSGCHQKSVLTRHLPSDHPENNPDDLTKQNRVNPY